jgi:magnesium-transporting ATPase (P-type)
MSVRITNKNRNVRVLRYKLLQTLEFNSTRKRMSVIVQSLDEANEIILFTKGADTVIEKRLQKTVNASSFLN